MNRPTAEQILEADAREIDARLDALLKPDDQTPKRLIEAMRYSVFAGGKRLRPTLVLRTFEACGGAAERRPIALAAAGAVELVHTFSLVHDDLPAMDDDDLRRGKPTNHKVFGEAMAILAGDALLSVAFELLASRGEDAAASLVLELARATGPSGMIGGQVLDIESEHQTLDLAGLQRVHRLKTGALMVASCRMGAISAAATEPQLAAVERFATHLGLMFQIIDDVLDVTADSQQLGKTAGKDAARGKNTYPSLLGVAESYEQAGRELHSAIHALMPLGAAAEPLATLARFVLERQR